MECDFIVKKCDFDHPSKIKLNANGGLAKFNSGMALASLQRLRRSLRSRLRRSARVASAVAAQPYIFQGIHVFFERFGHYFLFRTSNSIFLLGNLFFLDTGPLVWGESDIFSDTEFFELDFSF